MKVPKHLVRRGDSFVHYLYYFREQGWESELELEFINAFSSQVRSKLTRTPQHLQSIMKRSGSVTVMGQIYRSNSLYSTVPYASSCRFAICC